MGTSQKQLRAERRAKAIELLGGKCVNCGSTDNLQFDHIHPKQKSFMISQMLLTRLERLVAELEKCQLLCFPCHIEKTKQDMADRGVWRQPLATVHGLVSTYTNNKCRCDDCRSAWASYMRVYKQGMRVSS